MTELEIKLADALSRIADPRNTHFAGDAQVVAREALAAYEAAQAAMPAPQDGLMTSRERFILRELYEFQEATGCDTADEYLAATPAPTEPVGEVAKESDYWSRGHFYEGRRHVIRALKNLDALPVGTKLFAAPVAQAATPTPAQDLSPPLPEAAGNLVAWKGQDGRADVLVPGYTADQMHAHYRKGYEAGLAATPAPVASVCVEHWEKNGHLSMQKKAAVSVEVGGLRFYPMQNGGYGSPSDYSPQEAEAWAGKLRVALAATPAPVSTSLRARIEHLVSSYYASPVLVDELCRVMTDLAKSNDTADAERYRWLKKQGHAGGGDFYFRATGQVPHDKLDEAIDAAMRANNCATSSNHSIAFQYLRETVEKEVQPIKDAFEPTRSQRLAAAGYARRPSWKSLPKDEE